MTKIQEGQVVAYDKTVRVTDQSVVQLHYGSDDMDATRLERVRVQFIRLSDEAIEGLAVEGPRRSADKALLIAARDAVRRMCFSSVPSEVKPMITLPFQPERLQDMIVLEKRARDPCSAQQFLLWRYELAKDILLLWKQKIKTGDSVDVVRALLSIEVLKTDKPWLKILATCCMVWTLSLIHI